MNKKLLYVLGIILTILIGFYLNYKFCCEVFYPVNKNTEFNENNDKKAITNEIKTNVEPIILYFSTNAKNITLSNEQNIKLKKVVDYIENNPGSTIHCEGHADNTGLAEKNDILALQRAEFVKNFFINKGILSNKITVHSSGSKNPIDQNSSENGKAKNRRVEVTVN